jgi:methyl-accepting chemotaxis protein
MDQQLELEINGERTSNYLILFLIFIFAMTIVAFVATKYVRGLVIKFKISEDLAKRESEYIKTLLARAQSTVSDLDLISFSIKEISDLLKNISDELNSFSLESMQKINHFSNSIFTITSIAKEQENFCIENKSSILEIDTLSQSMSHTSKSILEFGIQSQKISQKTNSELEKSVNEIQNISKASIDASKIVALIDTIASQINLLALNDPGKNARQINELIQKMKLAVNNGETQIFTSNSSIKEINILLNRIRGQVQSFTDMIYSQEALTGQNKERTKKNLSMSQQIKTFTVEEKQNAEKLKSFLERILVTSQNISKNVNSLELGSEKLKEIIGKLTEEINNADQ